jgi:hypothetical protein
VAGDPARLMEANVLRSKNGLGALLEETGVNQVDVLKVDLEGAERSLFASTSASWSKVRLIVAELHSPYGFKDFANDVDASGSRAVAWRPWLRKHIAGGNSPLNISSRENWYGRPVRPGDDLSVPGSFRQKSGVFHIPPSTLLPTVRAAA